MKVELNLALQAAREAGELILSYFHSDYEIRDKGYHNPVTTADQAADKRIKKILRDAYPTYGWLSEETVDTDDRLERRRVWVVDPLDGTKEFIEGVPNFVVSIALVEDHDPILGVLYNPATREAFTASKGAGAWLNGAAVRVSEKTTPAEMVILHSRSETRRGLWQPYAREFAELRPVGSVAYKLGLIAAGKADVFASLRPKNEWDICAGQCLIREAGGKLVTLQGERVLYNQADTTIFPGLVAGNPLAVDRTLALLTAGKVVS